MNLKKIYNLRDAGGYPASGNKLFKPRMIYRSGQPDKGQASDLDHLRDLNIRTIIDLRPEKEWVRFPDALRPMRRLHLAVDITSNTMHRLRPYLHKKNSETQIREVVASVYRDMVTLFEPHWATLFECLSDPGNYPVLFHCRGGKDRTGVSIALLHMIAGVSREDMLKNYLLTNEFLLPRAKKAVKAMNIFAFGLLPVKNYEIAYAAREEYLDAFINTMLEKYGSDENYLTKNGVPEEHLRAFKQIILEQ